MLALPLASCGSGKSQSDGSGHMYDAALNGNPQSLDPQFANDPSSNTVIANLYSGLMKSDKSGNTVCNNAASYSVSEDGLVYTFKLREDNFWFFDDNDNDRVDEGEYFPVTAYDYVFALQRVLNPEMQSPYAEDFTCIKGGNSALSGSASYENIGAAAADDFTLIIQLEYPSADFINLLATAAAYPCNKEFFLSTKGRYGLDDNSIMSNGSFFVRQWFYDPYGSNNILYMRKNAANSSEEHKIYPSYLSFTIEKNQSDIKELFKNNKIDCITTMSASGYNKSKYAVSSARSVTLGLIYNPENEICSNLSLRKALALCIDRDKLAQNVSSDILPAYGIIPPAVSLLGRSYRELSSDKGMSVYDPETAASCFSSAKRSLNAESIDTVKMLVSTDSIDSAYLHLITQHWQEVLGYYIGIEEVTSEQFYERLETGDYQFALYPLTASYNSGVSLLSEYADCGYISVSEKSAESIASLKGCAEAGKLAGLLGETEAALVSEYSFIPLFYKNSYLIAGSENEDIILNPFNSSVDFSIAKNYD